jgi:hypothetical protein
MALVTMKILIFVLHLINELGTYDLKIRMSWLLYLNNFPPFPAMMAAAFSVAIALGSQGIV